MIRPRLVSPAVAMLIKINAALFLLQCLPLIGDKVTIFLALTPELAIHNYYVWQLLTSTYLHGGVMHILLNMLALWMFGTEMENYWLRTRFLISYTVCGLVASLGVCLASYCQILGNSMWETTLGASGAIMGIIIAFCRIKKNALVYIFPLPIPIKAKYLGIGYVLIDVMSGIRGGDGVSHVGHLGGALCGFLLSFAVGQPNKPTYIANTDISENDPYEDDGRL